MRDPLEEITNRPIQEDKYDYNVHYGLEKIKHTNYCSNKNPIDIFLGNLSKLLEYVTSMFKKKKRINISYKCRKAQYCVFQYELILVQE